MANKLQTIAELIADARSAAMSPQGGRRYLTCAVCGQMYDKTDTAQVSHHLSAEHAK